MVIGTEFGGEHEHFEALVDSGASFCALGAALKEYLKNKQRGSTAVRDYKGESTTMQHWRGDVNVCIYNEERSGTVKLTGKALDDMDESLISTSYMCETLGFTQIIRPEAEGRSYFEKVSVNAGGNVERIELPIQYVPDRRLYKLKTT